MDKVYVAIDLKSFYASVECVERGFDPLNTNLVVADLSRTEKTICLAVSPSLKSYGISGRARLFEVIQRVEQVNKERKEKAPYKELTGKSCIYSELVSNPFLALDYIVATPQMAHYMKVSAQIYGIYLKYVAPEDIFAYSVDEVFIDATGYLSTLQHGRSRICPYADTRCACHDGYHGYGRHRYEYVSLQGRYGYCGKAYSSRQGRYAYCRAERTELQG